PSLVFTFLFDGIQIDQVTLSTCDTGTLTYDTGNRSVSPPAAKRNLGKHTVQLSVTSVTGGAAPNGTATTSYTLTWGKPPVTVSPTSGIPTAKFTIRGKFVWTGPCPSTRSPIVLTFQFYWYKVESTKSLLWTTTASTCASKTVDTGNSPQFIPPAPLNFPSTF